MKITKNSTIATMKYSLLCIGIISLVFSNNLEKLKDLILRFQFREAEL